MVIESGTSVGLLLNQEGLLNWQWGLCSALAFYQGSSCAEDGPPHAEHEVGMVSTVTTKRELFPQQLLFLRHCIQCFSSDLPNFHSLCF